jgi:hypothetical protein
MARSIVSSCSRFASGLLVLSSAMALVGCADDAPDAAPSTANALTHIVPEAAGANCPAGGQAFQYGLDTNGNDRLDADEVKGTSYVCNGTSSTLTPKLERIPAGDPRCPHGGTALTLEGGATPANEIVSCNGAPGEQGQRGEQGAQGDAGAQGDPGPAATPPVFGQFFPSQIVTGAVLTCTGVSTATSTVTCTGMKLNGLDVYLGPNEANAICNGTTGKGYDTASGLGVVAGPWLKWTAGKWALGTGNTSPMQNLTCKR